MVIIVDDIRELISLCGMTPAQYMRLAAIIRIGRQHRHSHVRAAASYLNLHSHWILAERPGWPNTIALAELTWEEVFVLTAVVTELLSAMAPAREHTITHEILEGLDAAVESSLRVDSDFRIHGFRRQNNL